jgi:hypothetical protein
LQYFDEESVHPPLIDFLWENSINSDSGRNNLALQHLSNPWWCKHGALLNIFTNGN